MILQKFKEIFSGISARKHSNVRLPTDWEESFAPMFDLFNDVPKSKKVLFAGDNQLASISLSSVLIKSLMKAGYEPTIIVGENDLPRTAYRRLGIRSFVDLMRDVCPPPDCENALQIMNKCGSFADVLDLKEEGVCIGKYAVSSLLRNKRCGHLDLNDSEIRDSLSNRIARSLALVKGAQSLVDQGYQLAVMLDRGYSPWGELFDVVVNNGGRAILWMASHRNGSLILKRYNAGNANEHAVSLSRSTWEQLLDRPWSEVQENAIHDEIRSCYESQEWYSEVGTQVGKQIMASEDLRHSLGLDLQKPTAVIFSHIFWDATFFWGEDLFADYEEWFIESIKAACNNPNINWLVKVHPANRTKNIREGVEGPSSEVAAIRSTIGDLPDNVRLLDESSAISTYSLFSVMDYCLTVRGTVGIEAAMHGVRVLTAGTGRYDRHGFTIDFERKSDYLNALQSLQNMPKPDRRERVLAEKFAYGTFLVRPFKLSSLEMLYECSDSANLRVNLKESDPERLASASDIANLSEWLLTDEEDYLNK